MTDRGDYWSFLDNAYGDLGDRWGRMSRNRHLSKTHLEKDYAISVPPNTALNANRNRETRESLRKKLT